MKGSRNKNNHQIDYGEMDDESSINSNSTAKSLQDVELAESAINPQEGLPSSMATKRNKKKHRCFQELMNATERFASPKLHGMNPVVLCILATEAAERFAYYGFRASLVLYFTQELKMDDTTAISLFAFASYVANFTPICGAILGDGKLGRFQTIVAFGFVYWLGLIVLTHAAFLGNHTASQLKVKRIVTMLGLALICTGTGGIKPCVSIFGADQVNIKNLEDGNDNNSRKSASKRNSESGLSTMNSEEQERVRTFFSFFSMCINVGAVASFVIIPTIKGHYGFGAAFLVPTVFMCLAIIVFTSQRHNYVYRPNNPHGSSLYTTFRLCLWLLHNNLWDNKFIQQYFPSLEPGPVPLPSVVPTSSSHHHHHHHVEGITIDRGMESDDNTSISSMSASLRSLSQSVERKLGDRFDRGSSRSRSRSAMSRDSGRLTLDTSDLPPDHPLRRRPNHIGNGLEVPSRSPSASPSARRKTTRRSWGKRLRSLSRSRAPSVSGASLQTSDRYLAQQLSDAARALNVLPILAMLPCFWMLYDQQGSVWTLQASRMDLYGVIQPEQINVLNPIGLFLLIPVFDKAIYPALEKREIDISPLRRMGWGMILVSLAFYISGIVEYVIDYRSQNNLSQISVLWQIPQIALMTVAEIFISVTGLEFAYSVSPDRLKSFVMAAYLMTIAKGDFWGGCLYATVFRDMNQAVVLHIFAMLMMFNLAFYGYVVQSWELRHGVVSWDLFDKLLETEAKQRPFWKSHQRQFLNMGAPQSTPSAPMQRRLEKDPETPSPVEKTPSQRRGRGRWRRRDVAKQEKSKKKKSRTKDSKKGRERGSRRRRTKSSTQHVHGS